MDYILFGASGHGKVLKDIIRRRNENLVCFFDDDPEKKTFNGIDVFRYRHDIFENVAVIVSIGENRLRQKVAAKIKHDFSALIDTSCVIAADAGIGIGTVVLHGSVIQSSTLVGMHCIINTNASVDHDCKIGDYAHISPNATLCGGVTIGEGAHIGAGAIIIPNITVGRWSIIGAGTVIIHDVPDNAVVVGNPGRIIKH